MSLWATLGYDLRTAMRGLARNRGATAVMALTLALGIGANTVLFSVVRGVLLRPMDFPRPERLVRLYEAKSNDTMPSNRLEVAPANYLDWRSRNRTLESVAAFAGEKLPLAFQGEPEEVPCAYVGHNFFSLLRVQPMLGRGFTEEEDHAGHDTVAVLSFRLWQRRFSADPNVVGKTIQLDGSPYTVVGVMPEGFAYPLNTALWTPLGLNDNQVRMREAHFLKVIGRMREGVTLDEVRAEMGLLAAQLAQEFPATNKDWHVNVVPLLENEVGNARAPLLMLAGAAGLLLLIACANIASLQLARAVRRRTEFATRLALGASPARLTCQLLTESVAIAALGGVAGLVIAVLGVDGLVALRPSNLPRIDAVKIDAPVLGVALLVTLGAGLLCGLLPALRAARTGLQDSLKAGGRTVLGTRRGRRAFELLTAGEVAITLVMLAGAGLLFHSLVKLWRVDAGFDATHVLTAEILLPSARYGDQADWLTNRLRFYEDVLERLRATPGVASASGAESVPLGGFTRVWSFRKEGQDLPPAERPAARFEVVTRDYFRTMRIAMKRGRDFLATDLREAPSVVIVNESFARRFYPNTDPLGQRIIIRNRPQPSEIVGIVSDIRHESLDRPDDPAMYVCYEQFVVGAVPIVLRTQGDPGAFASVIRDAVRAADPTVAVTRIRTMNEVVGDSLAQRRFALTLLGLFASLGVLLTAVGVFSVMAYSVEQRTHEIGIRMALGATPGEILRMVLRQGMKQLTLGLGAGLIGAALLTRMMRTLLFGVAPGDPLTLAGVALLLASVAMAACYLPARHACRVDPAVALRHE